MKCKFLKLILLTICSTLFFLASVKAQESFDLPEIKGSYSQEYQELKIEITTIERLQEYQAYFGKSNSPRGKKLIAEPEQEIAVVHIHTKRLGKSPGISLYGISIFDSNGKEYEGNLGWAFIGTKGESRIDNPIELDYEFPVLVPKRTVFSAIQLRQPIQRDAQPYIVIQKITFDVSSLISNAK